MVFLLTKPLSSLQLVQELAPTEHSTIDSIQLVFAHKNFQKRNKKKHCKAGSAMANHWETRKAKIQTQNIDQQGQIQCRSNHVRRHCAGKWLSRGIRLSFKRSGDRTCVKVRLPVRRRGEATYWQPNANTPLSVTPLLDETERNNSSHKTARLPNGNQTKQEAQKTKTYRPKSLTPSKALGVLRLYCLIVKIRTPQGQKTFSPAKKAESSDLNFLAPCTEPCSHAHVKFHVARKSERKREKERKNEKNEKPGETDRQGGPTQTEKKQKKWLRCMLSRSCDVERLNTRKRRKKTRRPLEPLCVEADTDGALDIAGPHQKQKKTKNV